MSEPAHPEHWSMMLTDQLCFALYAASRAITGQYRPVLDPLGLTYPQYLVLLVLWERGQVPVKELGDALHLDYGTLSPLLKRLEARGLLRRQRSSADERSVLISLTAQGSELHERARLIPGVIAQSIGLERTEIDQLRATLRKMTGNIVKAGPPEPLPD